MTQVKVNAHHTHAVGRRKASTARAFLQPGSGQIWINKKPLSEYFGPTSVADATIRTPMRLVSVDGQFDVVATAKGGGITGQAEAVRLAVARALVLFEAKQNGQDGAAEDSEDASGLPWQRTLRQSGMLTRDSRVVFRKLVGRRKARKKEQYSKR